MQHRHIRKALPALACLSLVVSGCGGFEVSNVWPFGGSSKEQDLSRPPAGATAYRCTGGKHLFVRYLDNGEAAWVILPDREFRLNKAVSASGARYSNGNATLDTKGAEATLSDGAAVTYADCKAAG